MNNKMKKLFYSNMSIRSLNQYSLFYFLVFSLHKDLYSLLYISHFNVNYYVNENTSNPLKKNKVFLVSTNDKSICFSISRIINVLNVTNTSNELNLNFCLSYNQVLYHSNYYSNKIDYYYPRIISFFSVTSLLIVENMKYSSLAFKWCNMLFLLFYIVYLNIINIIFVNRFILLSL